MESRLLLPTFQWTGGSGKAKLRGTPAAGTDGTYVLTLKAKNGVKPNATRTFTLNVVDPGVPAIVSPLSSRLDVFADAGLSTDAVILGSDRNDTLLA